MKLSITSILVATLASLASAQANGTWDFKLRATTYRFATPYFSGWVDVDSTGLVGLGRSGSTYTGFVSTMTSADDSTFPVGEIHRKSDGVPGYLAPTATAGVYDFHYGAKPADETGILSEDFAITELICGGNCGGLQLRYDTGNAAGRWLAFADSAVEGAYTIKYWDGSGTAPEGGYPVWLWRDASS